MSDYQFKTQPYDHQDKIWRASRDLPIYGLLWEMGVGKSKTLLDTAGWLYERKKITGLLIVCWPSTLMDTWARIQIPEHLPERIPRLAVTWSPQPKPEHLGQLQELLRKATWRLNILVMNVEALSQPKGQKMAEKFLKAHPSLMVVDESTKIKHVDAKRSRAVRKLGLLAKYRRIMTGTPSPETPVDLFGQFEFLQEGLLGHTNLVAFKRDFCIMEKKFVNVKGRLVEYQVEVGYRNLDRLNGLMLKHSSRILKKDCLDLPPKIYKRLYIELTPQQRKVYDDLVRLAVAELEDEKLVTAPMVMTRIMALRQVVSGLARPDDDRATPVWLDKDGLPKMQAVGDLIEARETGSTLVWATFVPAVQRLGKELEVRFKRTVPVVHGAVPLKRRNEYFAAFQAGELRELVLQPQSGGYGLTLTKADLAIYHDNDWSLEVRLQTEDRNHRIGQDLPATYWDLLAKNTVDEQQLKALIDKDSVSLQVTGDTWRQWLR